MELLCGSVCREPVVENESMEHAGELFGCYATPLEHCLKELISSI